MKNFAEIGSMVYSYEMLQDKMEWENAHFLKENYQGVDLSRRIFRNCVFEGCDFTQVRFTHAQFVDCKWIKCNLSLTKWEGCRLQRNHFEECKIVGGDFSLCDPMFLSISFKKCLINMGNFSGLNLKGTSFACSTIRETHFSHTNLSEVDFTDCDLSGSTFHHTNLSKANFVSAVNFSIHPLNNKLNGAKFSRETALVFLECLGIVLI